MRDNTPQAVESRHDLLLWLIPLLDKFPRSRRFTLAERLEARLLSVLERLVEAAYSREKRASLTRANLDLEMLRHLWRLAFELQVIPVRRYEHGARLSWTTWAGRWAAGCGPAAERRVRAPRRDNSGSTGSPYLLVTGSPYLLVMVYIYTEHRHGSLFLIPSPYPLPEGEGGKAGPLPEGKEGKERHSRRERGSTKAICDRASYRFVGADPTARETLRRY